MLRTCPRCGDYFEGDAPPFCPADGTPLADAGPRDLDEGARVVKEKERLTRRRVRRLKLRRVFTTVMTMIVTTLVVYVVVANYVIYVKPDPEAPVLLAAVTPSPSPTSPTPVPLPTPPDTPTPSPTPTPTPTHVCTKEDRGDAEKLILGQNRGRWDRAIAADQTEGNKVLARYAPFEGIVKPGTLTYGLTFAKDCETATVTAHHIWYFTSALNLRRLEGSRGGEFKWNEVEVRRTLRCSKERGAWRCPENFSDPLLRSAPPAH